LTPLPTGPNIPDTLPTATSRKSLLLGFHRGFQFSGCSYHDHTANAWKSRRKNQQESEKVSRNFHEENPGKIATGYTMIADVIRGKILRTFERAEEMASIEQAGNEEIRR